MEFGLLKARQFNRVPLCTVHAPGPQFLWLCYVQSGFESTCRRPADSELGPRIAVSHSGGADCG